MQVREIVGLGFAVLGLAALSVMILNGGQTAQVFSSFANGFSTVIATATHPGTAGGQ